MIRIASDRAPVGADNGGATALTVARANSSIRLCRLWGEVLVEEVLIDCPISSHACGVVQIMTLHDPMSVPNAWLAHGWLVGQHSVDRRRLVLRYHHHPVPAPGDPVSRRRRSTAVTARAIRDPDEADTPPREMSPSHELRHITQGFLLSLFRGTIAKK